MSQEVRDFITIFATVIGVVTLAAVIVVTTLALTRGSSTPPCRKGGIYRVVTHAQEQYASGTGVLVICRNGDSVWP